MENRLIIVIPGRIAKYMNRICGAHADWIERVYICPECEEPIYECNWANEELRAHLYPICEFEEIDGKFLQCGEDTRSSHGSYKP